MEFDVRPSKVAGSVGALMQEAPVRRVMSVFGDGCLRCYGVDIRDKKSVMNPRTLRSVRSFVGEFGEKDAVAIVAAFFSEPTNGRYRGRTIGASIFTEGYRFLANEILMSSGGVQPWER